MLSPINSQPREMTDTNALVKVNVRIEGRNGNLFDGTIDTQGKNVTTNIGTAITNRANGMNGNEYPFQVPTCISALADTATGQNGRPGWGA